MVRFRSHYKAIATCAALFYRFSLIHWNHVMYLAHLETAYQSSQLVCQNHFLSTFLHFTFIDFGSIFSQGKSLMPQYLDLKWAIKKPYSRLRHATTSRAIKYQNWVARFSPRVVSSEAFKNNTYLDSLLLLFDGPWNVKAPSWYLRRNIMKSLGIPSITKLYARSCNSVRIICIW